MKSIRDKVIKKKITFTHGMDGILKGGIREWSVQRLFILSIIGIVLVSVITRREDTIVKSIILGSMFMSFEYFNTAIEEICDLMTSMSTVKIKLIKDLAAAPTTIVGLVFFVYVWYEVIVELMTWL